MSVRRLGRAAAAGVMVLAGAREARAQHAAVSAEGVVGYVGSAILVQGVSEEGTGLWYGGRVGVYLGPVSAEASGLKGTLAPSSGAAGFQRDGGEMRGVLGVRATSWLGFEGGYVMRAFDSPAGYQKWTYESAGARVSVQLGTPGLRGYIGGSYLVGAKVAGFGSAKLGVGVEAGFRLEPQRHGVTLGVFYRLERFDFPGGAAGRLEHFDCLGVTFGLR